MRSFTDPATQRRLQRLVMDAHPRGPQIFVQLLTDVADRIGGQPAIIAALEELAVTSHRRRHGIPPDKRSSWEGTTEAEASR